MPETQTEGHAEHTQNTLEQGLPGKCDRPINVTIIGAGSHFTRSFMNDIMNIPNNCGGQFNLVDIDADRLATMVKMSNRLVEHHGGDKWKITYTADRREVLAGSDYVIVTIEVAGPQTVDFDYDIPAKFGVDQCIGDTIGPGGLFKAMRSVPIYLDLLKDAEELCPDALVMNYTNPMSIMCLAAGRISPMNTVGLCHSVQGTSHQLAKRVGIEYDDMMWDCAGINHLAWFTKLEHQGESLYPKLVEMAKKDIAAGRALDEDDADDLVRKDMLIHFGAAITESSGHLSEYLPYYRSNDEAKKKYCRDGYEGGSRFYADGWPKWRMDYINANLDMAEGRKEIPLERSWEYASWIVEAREKHSPFRFHGNVMNSAGDGAGRLITNLPSDACVEVACLVDGNGVQPTRYGKLPAQMAGICASNMAMYDLAADACIKRCVKAAAHALMLDPLTSAICTPAQIVDMTKQLFEAEKDFLPGFE